MAFLDAAEKANGLRIDHRIVAPMQSREMPNALPRINTIADLATLLELSVGQLEWFADTKHWNRRERPGPLHHYRYEWRSRPGRLPRLLEIPEDRLRRAHRTLLERALAFIPTNDAAHGFVAGRSAITGAARHVASDVVIALDIKTFFARVTAARIFGTLRQAGFSEAVAYAITGLSTNAVSLGALKSMPPGGSSDDRFALRRALATSHLPQGSPASPMLANLAIRRLDSRLAGWAKAANATYTRYADDLAFSGRSVLASRSEAFTRGVQRIVEDEGYSLNISKTRIQRHGVRQTVTGIVVNRHINILRSDYDKLKATLHNCVVYGPTTQNHLGVNDFYAHLLGRVSWVESLNPKRGQKLREMFLRIRW